MGFEVRGKPTTHQNGVRFLFARVLYTSGTPSLLEGANDFTITDNGTGDFTLTVREPGQRAMVIVGTSVEDDTDCYVCVPKEATATTSARFLVYTDAGAAADPDDGIVHVTLVCFDQSSEN